MCVPGFDLDKFQWSEDDFISTLLSIKEKYNIDKVIINGDIYELYFFEYEAIKAAYPKLTKLIEETDWIIPLRGNHDELLTKFDDFLIFHNILIEHGNRGDHPGTNIFYFFAKIIDSIILKFPKLRKNYITGFRRLMKENEFKAEKNTLNYIRYGLEKLQYFDIVVLGHTHQFQKMKFTADGKQKQYYNCGACINHQFQGVVLDTDTGKGELVNVLSR
jgi:UDP-2,3-diacylglucosamine pyrophosphatase LpxH